MADGGAARETRGNFLTLESPRWTFASGSSSTYVSRTITRRHQKVNLKLPRFSKNSSVSLFANTHRPSSPRLSLAASATASAIAVRFTYTTTSFRQRIPVGFSSTTRCRHRAQANKSHTCSEGSASTTRGSLYTAHHGVELGRGRDCREGLGLLEGISTASHSRKRC